jgi:hypothetical protein
MTYFIDLRADASGGNPVDHVDDIVIRTDTTPNPSSSLKSDLVKVIQGRDLLLGTHGFNVNRAKGITNLSHWSKWLNLGANGYFVAVLWPGDSRWLPVVDYPVEDREAIHSGALLAEFLENNFTGANTISFASHSLGVRAVLETIRNLPSSFKLKTFTTMAGAIDDTCLNSQYKTVTPRLDKISVLASMCDDVLKWAFPVGNPLAGIISRGDPYWHEALGRYGPNPPDQPANLNKTPILPDTWNFGHGSYIDCATPAAGVTESGPFFPPPLVVPAAGAPLPNPQLLNWQQAWAAGFVSTRF